MANLKMSEYTSATPSGADFIPILRSDGAGGYLNKKATVSDISNNLIDYSVGDIAISTTSNLTISRTHTCSGTSSNYEVKLPVLSDGKALEVKISGNCTKLITLTVGADAVTKTGTVTAGNALNSEGTGNVSTSGNSTTLNGSSTTFTTQLRIGDIIRMGNIQRRVVAIASNTSLTMDTAATITTIGFSYCSNGITGSGTSFTTEYNVGDGITIGGVTRSITYIKDNTNLGVDLPFTTAPTGVAHGKTTTTLMTSGRYYYTMWAGETITLLSTSTGWLKIAGRNVPKQVLKVYKTGTDSQVIGSGTWTLVTHSASVDPYGLCKNLNNQGAEVYHLPRPGVYSILQGYQWDNTTWVVGNQIYQQSNNVADSLIVSILQDSLTMYWQNQAATTSIITSPTNSCTEIYHSNSGNKTLYQSGANTTVVTWIGEA